MAGKVGRPKKPSKILPEKVGINIPKFRCLRCGCEYDRDKRMFYKSVHSPLWKSNSDCTSLCRNCVDELFTQYTALYRDPRIALKILCHYLDVPYVERCYSTVIQKHDEFNMGLYLRQLNTNVIKQTYLNTILDERASRIAWDNSDDREKGWTEAESSAKAEVIDLLGYDPFDGVADEDRRYVFSDLLRYIDDEVMEDPYRLSQIVQIVNNNNQIRRLDQEMSAKMNARNGAAEIKALQQVKSQLVVSNDKIAKENEISVRNRSDKAAGRSTLTYLMRDLRKKNFKDAEMNYYDQLRGEGSLWAISMSMRALKENAMFDENDVHEIIETQRELINDLSAQLDDAREELRQKSIALAEVQKELAEIGG